MTGKTLGHELEHCVRGYQTFFFALLVAGAKWGADIEQAQGVMDTAWKGYDAGARLPPAAMQANGKPMTPPPVARGEKRPAFPTAPLVQSKGTAVRTTDLSEDCEPVADSARSAPGPEHGESHERETRTQLGVPTEALPTELPGTQPAFPPWSLYRFFRSRVGMRVETLIPAVLRHPPPLLPLLCPLGIRSHDIVHTVVEQKYHDIVHPFAQHPINTGL
jgi:hypothetical protein